MPNAGPLEVSPVASRRDLRRFVRLPWRIYAGNACWVPPLIRQQTRFLTPAGNPFFHHSRAELFLARRGAEIVGRIAAIENRRHLETYDDGTGFFGFFESVEDREVAGALIEAAAAWVRSRGLRRLRGPTSFTINDECGVLLDAFDRPPVVLMPYNPPYYPRLLEAQGFRKVQDLHAYRIEAPATMPERLRSARALAEAGGTVIRPVDLSRFDHELARIHAIHSRAWAENWGAVPLTWQEVRDLGQRLRPVVDPDLVFLAEKAGQPIGVMVSVPDVNQALRHLNGRLFPLGFLRFARYLRRIDALRVLIMGVLAEHRHEGIDAALYAATMEAGLAKGYRWGELSWILDSNHAMRRVVERLGTERYKTYRLYEKEL